MEPTGYTGTNEKGSGPFEYKSRLLTEADIDPSMVDWEIEGDGNPKRYLVWDELGKRWTYWQADPEDAHWEGEDLDPPDPRAARRTPPASVPTPPRPRVGSPTSPTSTR